MTVKWEGFGKTGPRGFPPMVNEDSDRARYRLSPGIQDGRSITDHRRSGKNISRHKDDMHDKLAPCMSGSGRLET